MTEKLKKCPFCGGEAEVIQMPATIAVPEDTKKRGHFTVWCSFCDLLFGYDEDFGGYFTTKEDAIEAWNRRAECTGQV